MSDTAIEGRTVAKAAAVERDYRKPCTLCERPRDVLVRCQIDETGTWHFVCPGSCWKRVSGGTIDGDGAEDHQWYRYGGMWKNKHEAVSAKRPKQKKIKDLSNVDVDRNANTDLPEGASGPSEWGGDGIFYTKNDKIVWDGNVWICRKTHRSDEKKTPERAYQLWKEKKGFVEDPD